MALLDSEKIALGTQAPDFHLPSVEGSRSYSLQDFADKKVLVVLFICAHCPYVQAIEDRIVRLRKDYQDKSVQLIGICSNDPTDYPEDRPENLARRAQEKGYGFPYLVDETQEVAKSYGAVCTPDIYVYGPDRRLAYHGRIDDHWKEDTQVTRKDLWKAIDALLADQKPASAQMPSMGCSIKWRKE